MTSVNIYLSLDNLFTNGCIEKRKGRNGMEWKGKEKKKRKNE